jgi:hypothetical protein
MEHEDGGNQQQEENEVRGVRVHGGSSTSAGVPRDRSIRAFKVTSSDPNVIADGRPAAITAQKARHASPYPASAPKTQLAGCLPNSTRPSGQPGRVARR